MSWTDRRGPWQRRQRRRVRLALLPLVGVLPLAGAPAFLLLGIEPSLRSAVTTLLMLAGPLLLATGVGAPLMVRWRRERQVLERIPAHDGTVCVWCRTPLPEPTGAADDASVACTRCGHAQTARDARRAWADYPHRIGPVGRATIPEEAGDGDEAARVEGAAGADAAARPSRAAAGPRSWRDRLRERPWIASLAVVPVMVAVLAVMAVATGGSVAVAMFEHLPMMLLFAGFSLVSGGFAGRWAGRDRRCVGCRYVMPPSGAGPRCPECGADWQAPGGTVAGRHRVRPWMIGLGLPLAAAGLVLVPSDWTHRLMPTGVLVEGLATGSGQRFRMWPELAHRTPTPGRQRRLEDGLLARIEADDFVSSEASEWLLARIEAGAMAPEQMARFVGDAMVARVVRTETATVGRPVRLVLELADPGFAGLRTAATWGLLVDGVETVGAGGGRVGAWSDVAGHAGLARGHGGHGGHGGRRGEVLEVLVDGPVPETPGPLRLRVHVRRAILPWGTASLPVARTPDGDAILPRDVIWSEATTVEHEVTVRPAGGG